jgi:hypothetical protein
VIHVAAGVRFDAAVRLPDERVAVAEDGGAGRAGGSAGRLAPFLDPLLEAHDAFLDQAAGRPMYLGTPKAAHMQ